MHAKAALIALAAASPVAAQFNLGEDFNKYLTGITVSTAGVVAII